MRPTARRPRVALLATLDTKRDEALFLRQALLDKDLDVLMVDVGTTPDLPPVPGPVVPLAGEASDGPGPRTRADALSEVSRAARTLLAGLVGSGELDAAIGIGGSGGTSVVAHALQGLPLWLPKLIVSTVASGDTAPYVGISDILLVPSLADIAGLNRVSTRVFRRAAAVLAGLLEEESHPAPGDQRPSVGATMFGVTTACVSAARRVVEDRGYEVLTFHATGVGGRRLEAFIDSGDIAAVLDVTTTELADEVVGGIMSAGPDRLTAAGRAGVSQVVSAGALDMVNFGPAATVPAQFKRRLLLRHNSAVTLMRTNAEENATVAGVMAKRLAAATGPTQVVLPTRGFSELGREGGPFWDPAADGAFIDTLVDALTGTAVSVRLCDDNINDPAFARVLADSLLSVAPGRTARPGAS